MGVLQHGHLGGAVAVSVETKQVRQSHRVEIAMPAAIARKDGHIFPCTLRDYSDGGVGIELRSGNVLQDGENITLMLKRGQQEYSFPAKVTRVFGQKAGLRMDNMSVAQHIEFIQCTFARADTWALWQDSFAEDKPVESLVDILNSVSVDTKALPTTHRRFYVVCLLDLPLWLRGRFRLFHAG